LVNLFANRCSFSAYLRYTNIGRLFLLWRARAGSENSSCLNLSRPSCVTCARLPHVTLLLCRSATNLGLQMQTCQESLDFRATPTDFHAYVECLVQRTLHFRSICLPKRVVLPVRSPSNCSINFSCDDFRYSYKISLTLILVF
jgi:hypothetical protein